MEILHIDEQAASTASTEAMLGEPENRSDAYAESAVLETCVAMLINEPSSNLVEASGQIASALSMPLTSDATDIDSLKQRFYDRFVISSSPWFVPSNEQCIRKARFEGGTLVFSSVEGTYSRHVVECYKTVGFDYRKLQGYEPVVNRLLPDSLAAELAFLASMRLREAEAETDEQAQSCRAYADKFATEHLAKWVDSYAAFAEMKGVDLYSEWAQIIARIVSAETDR